MAIGKISGLLLQDNLERQGANTAPRNLAIDSNVAYFDVNNRRVGINTASPQYSLDSSGNARISNVLIYGNTVSTVYNNANLTFQSSGNILFSNVAVGSANIYSGTGTYGFVGNLYGLIKTASQPNITSVGNLTSLVITGNLSAGNVSTTTATGTTAVFTNIGGTLTTASQPNITSVGNLTSLTVSGTITANGNTSLANISTTQITGTTAIFTTLYGNLFASSINGTVQTGNVSLYDNLTQTTSNGIFYPQLADKLSGNGAVYTASTLTHNPSTGELTATQFTGTGNFSTAVVTNLSSGNAQITGGSVNNLNSLSAGTGYITNLNSSSANISGPLFATSINSANMVSTGSTSGTWSTANVSLYSSTSTSIENSTFYVQLARSSTGNLASYTSTSLTYNPSTGVLSASKFTGSADLTTAVITNLSSGNVKLTGGYIQNLANVTADVSYIVSLNASQANISGPLTANSISSANINFAGVTTGTVSTANVSLYDSVTSTSTDSVFYPQLVDKATGNVSAHTSSLFLVNPATGNVTVGNIVGNLHGTVLTASQPYITTVGNLTALAVTGNITTSANVIAGNVVILSNLTVGNVTGTIFNGNITGTILTPYQPYITTLGTLTNLAVTGSSTFSANITSPYVLSGNIVTDNIYSATGTLTLYPLGTGTVDIRANTALKLPAGSTAERPIGTAGDIRVNTDTGILEYYGGTSWIPLSYNISNQSFSGDGTSLTYTLDQVTTEAGIIVSINGTIQQPETAYTVSGNQITFAEIPETTDVINIRYIAAAVTVDDNTRTIGSANVVVNTANVIIDTFDGTLYRSAKYTISSHNSYDDQLAEVLVLQGNNKVVVNTTSVIRTGANTVSFYANISGSSVNLLAQGTTSANNLRIQRTYFNV